MNLSSANQLRRLIPRWRRFSTISRSPETGSVRPVQPIDSTRDLFFQTYLATWNEDHSIENAVELVSYGIVSGFHSLVADAAGFLLEKSVGVTPAQRRLANEVLDHLSGVKGPAETSRTSFTRASSLDEVAIVVRKDIAKTKRELISWPRNALLWVELARLYSIVGQPQKASKAMQVAIGLAQSNRFVVRSAARLSVHHREPERALRAIHDVHGFQNDPWLLASEIAITCILGKSSRNAKRAVDILKRDRLSPEHTTELAGAVGTLEMTKGTAKTARAFFRQSLVFPNDNALAQAEWAAARIGNIDTTVRIEVLNPYEAFARHALAEADWLSAMNHTFRWAEDEPFSSAPSAIGSYVAAALLEDYQTSLEFCELGLQSNPEDLDVKNNKVVALTQLGRLDEAISLYRSIKRVESDSDNAAVITATGGLLAFRSGDASAGRQLYLAAAELAGKRKNGRIKAMAAIYLAREELRAGTEEMPQALARAERDFKGNEKDKEVRCVMNNLRLAVGMAP